MAADRGNDDRGSSGRDGRARTPVDPSEEAPEVFRAAVEELRAVRLRPEVTLADFTAPRGVAPFATAFSAEVLSGDPADEDEAELADGRFIVLHDPAGHEAWQGTFRLVTLVRAELEPEMAADPLLAEVGWSWLLEALSAHDASFTEPSGTVSRCSSQSFGAIAARPPVTEVEIRASWTPLGVGEPGRLAAHLEAWAELLCLAAGLPPEQPGVATLPPRRGPA